MSMIARGTRLCITIGLIAGIAGGIVGCTDDAPVPSVAVSTVGTRATAAVASAVAEVPAIRVTDDRGRAVKEVLVRWRVTAGGGRVLNDSVRTDRDGLASSGGWVLGTTAGLQTLTASADGVPPVVFTAEAAPGPVAQVVPAGAEPRNPVVGRIVTPSPAVRVLDSFGNPVRGVPVTFTVVQGGGTLADERQITDAAGLATVGRWQLGLRSGLQSLRADAGTAMPASIPLFALADTPADLVRLTPDVQSPAGVPVGTPVGVRVVDQYGNGVGGVPVTFTPGPNSGTVTSATVVSDPANGTAFVGSWTLGSAPVQTLIATSTALPGKRLTITATVVASQFTLDVRFIGPANTAVETAFGAAVARWKQLIVGRVHDVPTVLDAGACEEWMPAMRETIRDVVIFARIAPIDGEGSVLGQAYVCAINTQNNMPLVGVMAFDEADMPALIANGSLGDVILHEMGHVLGIGTLWNYGRALLSGAGGADPFFTGAGARDEFTRMNTGSYTSGQIVPVENSGGPGTRDAHWRESVLTRELMTGFLDRNASRPLSRLTVASLRDMGYVVNLSAADPFTITAALYAFPFVERSVIPLGNDVPKRPVIGITPPAR